MSETGRIYVVGIGPGSRREMSGRAAEALDRAEVIVGYQTYTDLLTDEFPRARVVATGMGTEVDRCREALRLAEGGSIVALVSGGDAGIYGMAGVMLDERDRAASGVPVEVIPGITAASSAAAVLGAPIMHDFAVVSLSDLLTEWELIRSRLDCAARGDFVICLYNPGSHSRRTQIVEAREILLQHRDAGTPVGIVRHAGRAGESARLATLETMLEEPVDMASIVIIGNSQTVVRGGLMITPRGYDR